MYFLLLPLVAVLITAPSCLAESSPSAPKPNSPTYTTLANYTGQFAIRAYRRDSAADGWQSHACNISAYGAPCNQPPLEGNSDSQVKIEFNVKNTSAPFRTWKNGTPQEVVVRLDYATVSQVDRGWRKKNQAYPGHGWHAKWTLATLPWSSSGEAVWNLSDADEVTSAVLYAEVCVICSFEDGTKDYCMCDRRNSGPAAITFETVAAGSITPRMRGAAIALSIFSPVFLIVFAIGDNLYYKRTGRALRFGGC
ncbi:hypothetical protein Agub_g13967 [Astrephomene gubernaculifera]|uniref:Uncharacterized protein n=1 Tax=Astrephomene gubernaculifera TaxID=47775 RepID=A0AAD3E394_9CHLO|nr:hypothetical protein Agub_g13967 [Astrephomene gubernaculifera]